MSKDTRSLSGEVTARRRYLRSVHLEYHEGQTVPGYIPTGRALEVLHRIARAMMTPDAGRVWSLTGPYGAGKSSFALFLHALLGAEGDTARVAAEKALVDADSDLHELLDEGRRALAAPARGFIRVATTAQREPVTNTVIRALRVGARAYWPSRTPTDVKAALVGAERDRNARAIGLALESLASHAPVLLVIDEFGKNLEHFATDSATSDLFVLQELAERCTGDRGLPAFLITLQHLAFDDYVQGTSAIQRREWGKVQGRFEDIPFVESTEQAVRLVSAAFDTSQASLTFERWRHTWATGEAVQMDKLGLTRLLPGGITTLTAGYPLHPLTLLALPEMCARFGQHGRTLFSFLTGREPHSVPEFLDATTIGTPLPTVGLDQLYDFFLATCPGTGGRHTARLTEIDTTLRESTGLTTDEQRVLKVVGTLNLLSQGGPLRASTPVIRYALSNCRPVTDREVRTLIHCLEQRGLLTFRTFADEYRLWQGSDLDLGALITFAREEIASISPSSLLTSQDCMSPAVAGRHSQRVGMLRYFDTVFADPTSSRIVRPDVTADSDGLVVYFLGPPGGANELAVTAGNKPVVVVTSEYYAAITEAVIELAAMLRTLDRPDVQADRVARRELQERAADARRRLAERIAAHLHPAAEGVTFRLADTGDLLSANRGLSSLLSDVCDRAYWSSPEIRNEMLGRRELTSQAAKARRELLTAMVDHYEEEWLGTTGYGPEKAMYAALLRHTGIHRPGADGKYEYGNPKTSNMGTVWGTLLQLVDRATIEPVTLDTIYAKLMAPPIGLKDGPIPVLLTALLLHRADDVAIYQDGTYQPSITPDLLERLVKSPDRFALKHFELAGDRGSVLPTIARALEEATDQPITRLRRRGLSRRNTSVLTVAAPLLTMIRSLPEYTLRTSNLSSDAEAVRDALLNARQPDELLFAALPEACDVAPFTASARGRSRDITTFGERLTASLQELHKAYNVLLTDCGETLAAEFRIEGDLGQLRSELRAQTRRLQGTLIEPRLRSFILLTANEDLDSEAWLEAVANNISSRPPSSWRDDDASRFDVEVNALAGSYRRFLSLHYEALAADRNGFDAHRITITNPDGQEHSSVVWVDQAIRPRLETLAGQSLDAAANLLGSRGGEALLALLAGSILGGQKDTQQQVATTSPRNRKKAEHD